MYKNELFFEHIIRNNYNSLLIYSFCIIAIFFCFFNLNIVKHTNIEEQYKKVFLNTMGQRDGTKGSMDSKIYSVNGLEFNIYPASIKEYTDAECKAAFVAEMNKKAEKLGMSDTIFYSPSGNEKNSKSTCKDLLVLGLVAFENNLFVDFCSASNISLSVKGNHERVIDAVNQYLGAATNVYKQYGNVLGGKGGNLKYTATNEYYRTQLTLVKVSEKPVLIALMGAGETSYNILYRCGKELVNLMKTKIDGTQAPLTPNLDTLVENGGGYGAVICPHINGMIYRHNYSLSKTYKSNSEFYQTDGCYIDLSTHENAVLKGSGQLIPCSVTKCMTALLACEYIVDKNLNIVIKTSDIEAGSGSTYYNGDIINIVDALTMMMLESSNTLANAVARTVGNLILIQHAESLSSNRFN